MRDRHETSGITYNAGMKGLKGSVHEGGTRVPFFVRWPNEFNAGEEVNTLINHYDLLPTIADIVDIDISNIPELDGQSFLPLLKNIEYQTDDRYRFFHKGRWPLNPNNVIDQEISGRWIGTAITSNPDSSMLKNYAVRSERYRFVNNEELYDVIDDPGQVHDVATDFPKIVEEMRTAYKDWWIRVRPLMINENVPLAEEKPFWADYEKQKTAGTIRGWIKPDLD